MTLLLQLHLQTVVLLFVGRAQVLKLALVDDLRLLGVHLLQLGKLYLFKLDCAGALLDQMRFVFLNLSNFGLQLCLALIEALLVLLAQILKLLAIDLFSLFDFLSLPLYLQLDDLILAQGLKSLLVGESALELIEHVCRLI